jgi:glyoxylase I family protein
VLLCAVRRVRLCAVSVLHHLALGTRDVARLARFYIDVLELREVTRHLHADGSLRSVWLDLGGSLLMIEPTDEPPRSVVGVGSGPFLLAVAVLAEERQAFEARLERAGSVVESRSEFSSYARDPDGNRIALSVYPLTALERS